MVLVTSLLTEDDWSAFDAYRINTARVPRRFKNRMKMGQTEVFVFIKARDLPSFYDPQATDDVDKPIGLKELLWRRGLWVDSMTRYGPKARGCKASDDRYAKKWKVHDIIYRRAGALQSC